MAKKLTIDTMFCDLRKVQEETLAQYESIEVDAMMVVVTPRVRELLARYPHPDRLHEHHRPGR